MKVKHFHCADVEQETGSGLGPIAYLPTTAKGKGDHTAVEHWSSAHLHFYGH